MIASEIAPHAARDAALRAAIAQAATTAASGSGRIAVLRYGIRTMREAGERCEHARWNTEAMQANAGWHAESMRALEVLIERTAASERIAARTP